ncbi:MerC domain-containing protein [Erythrobacter sp. HA6-11]
MPEVHNTAVLDRSAAALSVACIIHCVALPAMIVALPFLAVIAEAEWVHWSFALLAIAASGTVLVISGPARSGTFTVLASLGMALIVCGLFAEQFEIEETVPTLLGGIVLAAAHLHRLRRRHDG